jgi:hypothetical protein
MKKDMQQRWSTYRFTRRSTVDGVKGSLSRSWVLTKLLVPWILIGILMAVIARAYIPPEFFTIYLGPTIFGLLLTLVFATIIEVCAQASTPLSYEILHQTGAFGNSVAFLLAGISTNISEIGFIKKNIGWKTAVWVPILTIPQVLLLGLLFNILL